MDGALGTIWQSWHSLVCLRCDSMGSGPLHQSSRTWAAHECGRNRCISSLGGSLGQKDELVGPRRGEHEHLLERAVAHELACAVAPLRQAQECDHGIKDHIALFADRTKEPKLQVSDPDLSNQDTFHILWAELSAQYEHTSFDQLKWSSFHHPLMDALAS